MTTVYVGGPPGAKRGHVEAAPWSSSHPAGLAREVILVLHDASTAITFAKRVLEAAGAIGYGD